MEHPVTTGSIAEQVAIEVQPRKVQVWRALISGWLSSEGPSGKGEIQHKVISPEQVIPGFTLVPRCCITPPPPHWPLAHTRSSYGYFLVGSGSQKNWWRSCQCQCDQWRAVAVETPFGGAWFGVMKVLVKVFDVLSCRSSLSLFAATEA